jgi:hypothetical protein
VLADPAAQDFVQSTSGMRRLDVLPELPAAPVPMPRPAAPVAGRVAGEGAKMQELQPIDGAAPAEARPATAATSESPDIDSADLAGGGGEDEIARAVLNDLQRHVDLMLEYRLRASLTPLLTQVADSLVRELKQELALTLRDVVKRAVNQEVLRRRRR